MSKKNGKLTQANAKQTARGKTAQELRAMLRTYRNPSIQIIQKGFEYLILNRAGMDVVNKLMHGRKLRDIGPEERIRILQEGISAAIKSLEE